MISLPRLGNPSYRDRRSTLSSSDYPALVTLAPFVSSFVTPSPAADGSSAHSARRSWTTHLVAGSGQLLDSPLVLSSTSSGVAIQSMTQPSGMACRDGKPEPNNSLLHHLVAVTLSSFTAFINAGPSKWWRPVVGCVQQSTRSCCKVEPTAPTRVCRYAVLAWINQDSLLCATAGQPWLLSYDRNPQLSPVRTGLLVGLMVLLSIMGPDGGTSSSM